MGEVIQFPGVPTPEYVKEIDPTQIVDKNAKAIIVNRLGEALVLQRSIEEDTRIGGADFVGGSFEPGEANPVAVITREAKDELPHTRLHTIAPLYVHVSEKPDPDGGKYLRTTIFGAIAIFPETGIQLSSEHSGFKWFELGMLSMTNLPNKYKTAALIGAPILNEFAALQYDSPELFELTPEEPYVMSSSLRIVQPFDFGREVEELLQVV